MADLIAQYNGSTIAEWTNSGQKTFQTSSKYCSSNIILTYNAGGTGSQQDVIIARTISGTYTNNRVTTIGAHAFRACSNKLTAVSFPNCTAIGNNAFYYCRSLTTVSFPKCKTIGNNAFWYDKLTTANFPECTTIGNYAFEWNKLSTISFPKCTNIGAGAFSYCRQSLQTINFPQCTTINNYAFHECAVLSTASFPKCTNIGAGVFNSCTQLLKLYLTNSSIATLSNSNTFTSTPIGGKKYGNSYGSIYVPSSLLTSYKAATNWTYFSSRFVGV